MSRDLAPLSPRALSRRRAIEARIGEFVELRRELHQRPELAFQEQETSERLAGLLRGWGYDVASGLAGTGLVASLTRGSGSRILGLRADMDALPIQETTGLDWASVNQGVSHACGHDGHMAILLAAARWLAEEGEFSGVLRLILQPAEEIGAGAKKMIEEGLFTRFPVDAVFGLHNWPGVPVGKFGFVTGPAMASVDLAEVRIKGQGGHGAEPHETIDPVLAAAHVVTALQSIVSRNVDPREMAVVTVGAIHGGAAANVIPEFVDLRLSLRAFTPENRAFLQERVPAVIKAAAAVFGAEAEVRLKTGFPSLINPAAQIAFAQEAAEEALGPEAVLTDFRPRTASEDFAYMLQARPGAYLFVGIGEGAPLHSPAYRFNDAILAPAATFWAALAERFLQESPA
ncbi:M20 aminoacylase family protein [Neomegalonema perideroedes]|uniref:M20 aminoacylase family protein n=1 Tax=Neomegalonema perideroedes TaxID=217219 RepID=UPI000369008F|nr:M20 aminoacylase family protein [Neomegalonema perideroedes]